MTQEPTPLVTVLPDLTRPLVGIENRTAQEVFDIMCAQIQYAIRALSNKGGEGSEAEDDWLPIADAWKYGDAKLIVTDGQAVHGAAWWHSREQAWLDCDGIVPTLFQPLPKPPASNKGGRDGE